MIEDMGPIEPGEGALAEDVAATPREAPAASAAMRGVAASALIVAAGQLLSRLMGLVRETVNAHFFGASAAMAGFTAASAVPQMVYDLLLGGMVSAALVPVLSEYAGAHDRKGLSHLASTLLTVGIAAFVAIVILLELGAPVLAWLVAGGLPAEQLALTTHLIRLILPSLVFFCAWGVTASVLYARQQFTFPAMAAAVYNLGMILAAVFLGPRLSISALSIGVVLGSLLQLLIVLPGLRGLRLHISFDVHHPALKRIAILYLPVIGSLIVAEIGVIIDRNLASRTAEQALAWMAKATFLYQLPLGLVSVAIATATLPTLARITNDPGNARFRRTLASALRLVIVLILPAFVGLIVLGQDGIRLIFEHGAFTAFDTSLVTRALLFYLPGLPFAAIDQPLVFAFYSRKDTVTPVLVGIAGVCTYLLVGPLLAFVFHLGMIGLVIANTMQLTAHCILMWALLQKRFGSMAGLGMASTAARALLASTLMGLSALATLLVLRPLLPDNTVGRVLLFAGAGGTAVAAYIGALYLLKVEELTTLANMVRARLGRLGA